MQDALEIFEQIREATQTIQKLPRVGVKNRFCNWPDFIRDYHEMYDPEKPEENETARSSYMPPTARQLTELDEVTLWLSWLTLHPAWGKKYSRVIWAKACGVPITVYAKRLRKSERSCREWFRMGIHAIYFANADGIIK